MKIRSLLYLSFPLLLFACAHTGPAPTFSQQSYQVHPGKVIKLSLPFQGDLPSDGKLKCAELELPFEVAGQEMLVAYLPQDYHSKEGPYWCHYHYAWKGEERQDKVALIKVEKRWYPKSVLRVDPKRVKLSQKDFKRVEKEWLMLQEVYKSGQRDRRLFRGQFIKPLKTKVTSIYGTRRLYNNSLKGYHSGVDFRAPIGTPIPVTNDGKVVYVGDLFYTGNTVIVDHGLGIFSLYCHLSETKTSTGDLVKRGDVLGLAGDTGRVTGPHLHWGVKIHGVTVDGLTLVKAE